MLKRILFIATLGSPVSAETLIECGSSKGWAFYLPGGGIAEEEAGWVEDGISNGAITLTENNNTIDLLMKDARGMYSVTSDGTEISLIDIYGSFATVLVNYPGGSKELYTFDFARKKLTWSQHKFGGMFDKAQTFVADCEQVGSARQLALFDTVINHS